MKKSSFVEKFGTCQLKTAYQELIKGHQVLNQQ